MVVLETCPSNKYLSTTLNLIMYSEIMKQQIALKNAQKIEFCCQQSFILRVNFGIYEKTLN